MIDTKLTEEEIIFINTRNKGNRLLFALHFKYYKKYLRFFKNISDIPNHSINDIANTLKVAPKINIVSTRTLNTFYLRIRNYFKESPHPKIEFYKKLSKWLEEKILPKNNFTDKELKVKSIEYLKELGIDLIKEKTLFRIIKHSKHTYENKLFYSLYNKLTSEQTAKLNGLLLPYNKNGLSNLGWLNKDITNPSLNSIIELIGRLKFINKIKLEPSLLSELSRNTILDYANKFTRFSPINLKQQKEVDRIAQFVIFLYIKKEEIVDSLIDMFLYVMHKITTKADKRVIKDFVTRIHTVYSKDKILFNIAQASLYNPNASIKEVIYPIVNEKKLKNIIDEYQKTKTYEDIVYQKMRSSYASYYRQMVKPLLEVISLYSNNTEYAPILDGIKLIKKYFDQKNSYYPKEEKVNIDFFSQKTINQIYDKNHRVNKLSYEVHLLKQLSEKIKCREIWLTDSFKHRNPDEDLPLDFETKKESYLRELALPLSGDDFVNLVQLELQNALNAFNKNIINNPKVKVKTKKTQKTICLSPLEKQLEGPNITLIKKYLQDKWSSIDLIDILKEVELYIGFTKDFVSYGEKSYLSSQELSERILLNIYAFGTNVGLKYACNGNNHISYNQLRHIKDYYITPANLRNASNKLASTILNIRDPKIWGDMPTAIASDSTQFSAYFQNLISEYHNRYGGRGVMIYWHVEKNAVCVYSQLKNVSSSEVASMIQGILRQCTEMTIDKSYVDTHGQSEIGFGFARLLNFNLMPRLADINKQKLSRVNTDDHLLYCNIKDILGKAINWKIIKEQYTQMVKYSFAMKEGHADAESILRRFNKGNIKHPVSQALTELGKAMKTIFLCKYLMHENIRQEIHAGLNVVELWNCVSKFIFYGRSGEISSNNYKMQNISVQSLHLLQLSVIYINTLLIQQVIKDNNLLKELTQEDLRGLTPLIYEHINPYGQFILNFTKRIPYITQKENK